MTETQTALRPAASPANPAKPKTAGRRGRPVGDREAQRKKLLRAGIEVIAEEGYAGASLRKVAKKAGHTTGAITYYFADKEAMVRAVIEHIFDGFDNMLAQMNDIRDFGRQLEAVVDMNANSYGWLAGFQLLARARHEPSFAEIYQSRYASYRDSLASLLEKEQAAGAVRKDISADLLADHLGSIADGWMMMLPLEPERFAPERLTRLIESVMRLLQPPSG